MVVVDDQADEKKGVSCQKKYNDEWGWGRKEEEECQSDGPYSCGGRLCLATRGTGQPHLPPLLLYG